MMRIRKFNESIEYRNIDEQIDEILDNLKKKGKLSKSEKEFMIAASTKQVVDVTIPKMTGDFWADMANPHNIGIMWNNGKIWKQLKSVEEEEDEKLEKSGMSSDDKWEIKRKREAIQYLKDRPGLKQDLEKVLEMNKKLNEFIGHIREKYKNNYNDKIDHVFNSESYLEDSIVSAFGYYDEDKKTGESIPKIY
jgi:hypothetical protein